MSEMAKLTEKLKPGRQKARKAEREGKALPDLLSNMASNRGVQSVACGAFANKEHVPAHISR